MLAIFTAAMAGYTKRAAKAASDEAEATVKLVESAMQDRELAWRPWITIHVVTQPTEGTAEPLRINVVNLGVGPALRCLYLCKLPWGEYRQFSQFDLPAGNSLAVSVGIESPISAARLQLDPQEDGRDSLTEALICSDIFGNRYRFRPTARPPDTWLRDTDFVPNWAQDLPE